MFSLEVILLVKKDLIYGLVVFWEYYDVCRNMCGWERKSLRFAGLVIREDVMKRREYAVAFLAFIAIFRLEFVCIFSTECFSIVYFLFDLVYLFFLLVGVLSCFAQDGWPEIISKLIIFPKC